MLAMHAGRQHFIAKCQGGLQQSHGARSRFEMSDVRFNRSERHGAARELITAEYFVLASRQSRWCACLGPGGGGAVFLPPLPPRPPPWPASRGRFWPPPRAPPPSR